MRKIKELSLFGDDKVILENVKRGKTFFEDYEGFVEKFKTKKTAVDYYYRQVQQRK